MGLKILNKISRVGRVYSLILLLSIVSVSFLYGCGGKVQPQKKLINNRNQGVKIAVSFADMERDGNMVIKNTMTARQKGSQGQQKEQQGQQQEGSQEQQQNEQQNEEQDEQQDKQGEQQDEQQNEQQEGQQGGPQGGQERVSITWLDAKNDPDRQEKDIDQLVNQDVKAVVLQPVDPTAGAEIARKLAQANIKVIALEALPVDAPIDGYIASDHDRAGKLLARFLLEAAQENGPILKTVLLKGDKDDQVSTDIAKSLLQNLEGQSGVQIVQAKDHPEGDPQMVTATLEQVLTSTGNGVDAVVATDSRMAAAAADLLKKRGLSDQVVTIGVGADQKASQALVKGDHDAEIDVMPELMAQHIYDAAVNLATTGHWQNDSRVENGDFDVPAKITPVRLITQSESYLLEQRWAMSREEDQGQEEDQSEDQQDDQNGQSGQQSQGDNGGENQGQKTTLKITTQEGKTVEVQIDGEIKKIETSAQGEAGEEEGGGDQGGGGEG